MANRIISTTELHTVDPATGELKEFTSTKIIKENVRSSEHFFMTYIEFISPLFKLRSNTAKSILLWMCKNAEFDTGRVFMPSEVRKRMIVELEITPQILSNCLALLKSSNLIDGKGGLFLINPQIFWKGGQQAREEILRNKQIVMTFGLADIQEENIDNTQ